uniref:DEP domain-containing protein n=1 Tax=Timspurckia oligopyrenoides TaxID=708627 RepID=A0A7S0ZKA3_9RHOD|mmetsp:Transcript_8404/g.15201  ORF Transcript_8404/g.15201 Transcript_8404/m.15201 type:complete len:301 (+) Transcript_8404:306-1208(+)
MMKQTLKQNSSDAISALNQKMNSMKTRSSNDNVGAKVQGENLFELASSLRDSMCVKDRLVGLTMHSQCVLASDIVKVLVSSDVCSSVGEAEKLGNELCEAGHIYAVDEEKNTVFHKGSTPYKFSSDDRDLVSLMSDDEKAMIKMLFRKEMNGKTLYVGMARTKNAVSGELVTKWIVEKKFAKNRGEATGIAQFLINEGMMHRPYATEQVFKDGSEVYRLGSPLRFTTAAAPHLTTDGLESPKASKGSENGSEISSEECSPYSAAILNKNHIQTQKETIAMLSPKVKAEHRVFLTALEPSF